ncbi:bifunctional UDP-N-acetylglucosamine diphosphorylase/glucosamine-1-phosphate N-acetyltransferase GlmU [Nitriliruptor alkaliphilus]|uniref:bifunctional UDP-N-acetylglucosamine diphosphorylase/glucosamine-1-phosphate N-acetyltransferase GlmU n=1 Tax=Nitriliruptor alkaliphilus TaxID=427918 RepID=UPI0009F90D01|nr:bifunctional UDP-N-acetylglucosamine diphosphorylase/glucosamine-1-phosphate N-acetyltransferase GlmU [Nitriliruptor alkaliphilus]
MSRELESNRPTVAAIVLAAGKGTRFRSDLAKVLHRAAGRSLVGHALESIRPLGLGQIIVVVGHQREAVAAEVASLDLPGTVTVVQEDQRGTGHAVQVALPALADDIERVLVLPGDTPLLTAPTLYALDAAADGRTAAMLTAVLDDPTGYGRVLRDDTGNVSRIVEHRDATAEERAVGEVNAGMYLVDRGALEDAIGRIDDANDQGELYLTDVVGILTGDGREVGAVVAAEDEVAGVNDRWQLAAAAGVLRQRHIARLAADVGVTVDDPCTTHVDVTVRVERDARLLPGTILEGTTVIGERAVVGPNSHLTDTTVGTDATVHSTRADEAVIGDRATVGPFTHLRAGTRLGVATKAGAFVETKNAEVGEGTKIPHLAYIGDATLGTDVNIACGVITVNYDGRTKSHTTVGDGAFVGCDVSLVAPVTIGDGAYVAAGSVVTDDVPSDALAIARSRQVNKEGWAAER